MNWQKPRQPTRIKKRGLVVIHCDDGRMTDYTKWLKTIQRAIQKNDQYHAKNNAVYSPCVNSGYLLPPYNGKSVVSGGNTTIMTADEMLYIQNNGGEILSHGFVHSYFDYTQTTQEIKSGDTSIFYKDSHFRFHPGQQCFIQSNGNKEYYKVVEVIQNSGGENEIIIDKSIENNHPQGAQMHLSESTLENMTKGQIDFLKGFGIECKNHINPWYRSSELSDSFLSTHFNSIIKTTGLTEDPSTANVYNLIRLGGVENTADSYFIAQLDKAEELDGVAFVQGHGGSQFETLRRLEMIIDYAYEKNMRIVKHQKAVEHILNKQ